MAHSTQNLYRTEHIITETFNFHWAIVRCLVYLNKYKEKVLHGCNGCNTFNVDCYCQHGISDCSFSSTGTNSSIGGQEIPQLSWNPKVHYCVHKSSPLKPTLSYKRSPHFFTTHFNILPSTTGSSKRSPSLDSLIQSPHCASIFFENCKVTQLVKEYPAFFTELQDSLPYSQKPAKGPHPEPAESGSPCLNTYLRKVHLNVILPPTPRSPQRSLTFGPPNRRP
jgi:hypothetical protein